MSDLRLETGAGEDEREAGGVGGRVGGRGAESDPMIYISSKVKKSKWSKGK